MNILICMALGYFIGTVSPSALLAKWKGVNLRSSGTGNLGASNTTLVLGRGYGIAVMVIDIFKAYIACVLAQKLFPEMETAGYITGLGTVLGHVYPFYMRFKGGKGLACYGGMVCFYNPWLLLFYLTGGVALMILANRSIFLAVFVAVSFPLILLLTTGTASQVLVVLLTSALLLWVHRKNFGRVKRGEEAPMQEIVKTKILRRISK